MSLKKQIHQLLLFLGGWLKCFMRIQSLPLGDIPALNNGRKTLILLKSRAAFDELAFIQCAQQSHLLSYQIVYMPSSSAQEVLAHFHQQLQACVDNDTQLIPISLFWGRKPELGEGFWRSYLTANWMVVGWFRRFLTVIMQIKKIYCYWGTPILLTELCELSPNECFETIRQQFIKHQEAVIGPDLSHQRIMADRVVHDQSVQNLITASQDKIQAEKKARQYIKEIASDYAYPVVKIFDYFLTWVFEKLYDGVEIQGFHRLQEVAEDYQLVYVPCHRSHIDYLLLSYVIYHQGLMPPHIAAGINLNLPVVGPLLRRGGAFFIRRKFRGNKLYRAVLEAYVSQMCHDGFSIEYFIEGGRSRTGLLLQPKPGMLAMTMDATRNLEQRKICFVPVYIGYEKLLESHSYINELYGSEKQKESLWQIFSARKFLRQDFGKVYLHFGDPILPKERVIAPDWHQAAKSQAAFFSFIEYLGQDILTAINQKTAITSTNLMAISLLSSPQFAMLDHILCNQMQLLKQLLQQVGFKDQVYLYETDFEKSVSHAEKLKLIKLNQADNFRIIYLDQAGRSSATFLRNNNLHCFILPALLATILVLKQKATQKRLVSICSALYPYLKSELFLPWNITVLPEVIESILVIFKQQKLITQGGIFYTPNNLDSMEYNSLLLLSHVADGNIQRFYIVAKILAKYQKQSLTSEALIKQSVLVAKKVALLHQCHEPDFFDEKLFSHFISQLIQQNLIAKDEQHHLLVNQYLLNAINQAQSVLTAQIRRSIEFVVEQSRLI